MATPRRKWSTTTVPSAPRKSHESQAAAYRYIKARAVEFHAGMLRADLTHVSVWVDERDGHGWRLSERINLADHGTEG